MKQYSVTLVGPTFSLGIAFYQMPIWAPSTTDAIEQARKSVGMHSTMFTSAMTLEQAFPEREADEG